MESSVIPIEVEPDFIAPVVADIRVEWDTVRPGIEEILEGNPQLTYRPEDVYSECVNERATLFTSPVGFLVLTTQLDPFTGDKTLLIWIAYTYKKGAHNWVRHVEWFEEIAQVLSCRFIEARSAVPELEAYALKHGWSLDTRVYLREVFYG